MKLKSSTKISTKPRLSQTLRGWLPILQADIESLKETLDEASKDNPFIQINSGSEVNYSSKNYKKHLYQKNAISDEIEALSVTKKSLFDRLSEQIEPPYFPTKTSQSIASEIIKNINDNGYFDGSCKEIAQSLNTTYNAVENVRLRFAYLEPSGIGAIDLYESFIFQLNDFDLDNELYNLIETLIKDFENLQSYSNRPRFLEAIKIIRKFKNPPALEYKHETTSITPDIFINSIEGEIKIELNDNYYPEIVIDTVGVNTEFEFVKDKLKSARNLVEALAMRKETLTKIALMIVEYQYDFFKGGDIKPMKLDNLASELDRHHSTISRAISNKYLSCDRGVYSLKSFFATALDDSDTSNVAIKSYIKEIISSENKTKPLSDNKILELVRNRFNIKLGRRTITKYRISQNISSSSDRKKEYLIKI
jgi:RNA polymerase sigma-54 factor